nr:hypothetical protein [Bacteroides intestinalis]
MNKKFLSVILFSALMVGTAGTFTSCKDYDDDIENLNKKTGDLSTQLTTLQSALDAAKSDIAAAKSAADAAKEAAATAKAEAIQAAVDKVNEMLKNAPSQEALDALKTQISAIETNLATILGTVDANAAAIAQLKIQMAAVEKYKALIDANAEEVAKINGAIEIINEAMKDLATIADVEAIDDKVTAIAAQISSINDGLVTLLTKELRSLVFYPELYVGGIEATEYEAMRYMYMKTTTTEVVEFNDEHQPAVKCIITEPVANWNYAEDKTDVFAPIDTVKYHMNPSSALVDKLSDLSFVSRETEYITRSNDSKLKFKVENMEQKKDGFISVGYSLDKTVIYDKKYDNAKEGEASIFALSANVKKADKDTTITSDYAMAYISEVTPKAIAYKSNDLVDGRVNDAVECETSDNPDELWTTVKDAIENAPTLQVAYDESIDLKKVLATHYDWATETKNKGTHKIWPYGAEAKFGLKYDFALIQYKTGTNVTSDSKYVQQDITSGVITPSIVNEKGETLNQQGISSVGKRPLIRVRVLDNKDRVVLVGYIKLQIIKEAGYKITDEFPKDAKFGCEAVNLDLTWAEISYQLLEKTATQSKDEFDALYKFTATSTVGTQFELTNSNEWKAIADTKKIYGTVKEIADPHGTTNTILRWTLTKEDMQRIYQESDSHSKTIYVRYESKQGETANAPIYMPLTATVLKPVGAVKTKIAEYWYENGTTTRLNVAYPKDGGNTLTYVVELDQVWEVVDDVNKPQFSPTTGFASYTDAIFAKQAANSADGGYKYFFAAENNGYELPATNELPKPGYFLFVDNTKATDIFAKQYDATYDNTLQYALKSDVGVYTNTKLYAATSLTASKSEWKEIATINQATGEITYVKNSTSEFLLNYYGHSNAQLVAQIGVVPYTPCAIAMATQNSVYPAKFLRPIDANPVEDGEFTDAEANGSKLNIADLFHFSDWRDKKFVDFDADPVDYSNAWLFAYYNVKQVKVLIDKITTDMNGHDINNKLLSQVSTKVKFSQLNPSGADVTGTGVTVSFAAYNKQSAGKKATYDAIKAAMGQIKYENNGNNVGTFKVRIPVEFTYDWGVIQKVWVDCVVKNTIGNN